MTIVPTLNAGSNPALFVATVNRLRLPALARGPMFYASSVGLPQVVDAIKRFQKGYQGDQWKLAPLLARLAVQGETFSDYTRRSKDREVLEGACKPLPLFESTRQISISSTSPKPYRPTTRRNTAR